MIIYQPYMDSTERVAWYGGESTQLHYEQYVKGQWIAQSISTLMCGIPSGMSEMHAELVEYYNCCQ